MKCNNCGKPVNAGEKFCRNCGHALSNPNGDNALAIISVVCGVLAILIGALFFPICIIGLILGICQKGKSGLKTTGIVLNSIGIALAIIIWIFFFGLIFNVVKNAVNDGTLKDFGERFVMGTTYEEEEYNDWDQYINLRDGATGVENNIEGGWRILSDKSEYIEFKNNTFYYYPDINDRENNYVTGTYETLDFDGKLEKANKLLDIIKESDKSDSDFTLDNVVILELIPKKRIQNGETIDLDTEVYNASITIFSHNDEGLEGKIKVYDLDMHDNEYMLFSNDNYIKLTD